MFNLLERFFSAQKRREDAKKGNALPDGSFPIESKKDLANARSLLGHAKNKAAAARHIAKRAKALGERLKEDDGVDPITLYNLIGDRDVRDMGYGWIRQSPIRKSVQEIFRAARQTFGSEGEFIKEDMVQTLTPSNLGVSTFGNQAVMPPPRAEIELNGNDPNIRSSDPNYNPCPAFLSSVCRVDGRPCMYNIYDYKECGKYSLAKTGDPGIFEIPIGREQAPEYQLGIKA